MMPESGSPPPGEPGGPPYSLNAVDFHAIYPELKRIARKHLRSERSDHTLQPTALIHELYLQLMQRPNFKWTNRSHFLLYSSRAMRNLLVDYARRSRSAKRWPGELRVDLSAVADSISMSNADEILEVDSAMTELAAFEPRWAQVVELRTFAGLTFVEIGEIMDVSDRTAKRDWALAEEWLVNRLRGGNNRERGRVGNH